MAQAEQNKTFSYHYSAANSEVIRIRSKYLPKKEENNSERKPKLTKLKYFLKNTKTTKE